MNFSTLSLFTNQLKGVFNKYMRNLIIIATLFSLLVAPLATVSFAQDDIVPTCSADELTLTIDTLSALDEGFATVIAKYDLSADATDAAYGETLVALDTMAYEYWNTAYPELPECAESQALAFIYGAIYDEYLTIALLNNIAAWTDAADMVDDATVFATQAAARLDDMNADLEELSTVSLTDLAAALAGSELASCTEDEVVALADAMSVAFDEIGEAVNELEDEPVWVFALTEGAAYTFDAEVFAEVSTCAENQSLAWLFSLSLNEINIIAGLYANAAAEDAAGNTDVAEVLATSAEQRYEDFMATWDEMSAE